MVKERFIEVINIASIVPNPPETLSIFFVWRVGLFFLSVLIAVFVGIFWASIAALAFPSITLPVFLVTCSITFIALGLCLVSSETTNFDQEQI
jgi:hypothetical protein